MGEYHTQPGCEVNCTGENSRCYKNYRTGCWECVKLNVVEHKPAYNESRIVHCNHQEDACYELLLGLVGYDFHVIPMACSLFATERINLAIEGAGVYSIITFECFVDQVNPFPLEFPSVNAFTDIDTVDAIAAGSLTFEQAMAEGKIFWEKIE
jgi:hypothetical protein